MSEPSENSTCDLCGKVCADAHGLRSHMQKHREPRTCDVCGRDNIKLMIVHKKHCPGPPPDYEPHIEVDLRKWEYLEHRVPELEGQLAERDEKIASMGRTAERKNTQIRNLNKRVSELEAK